MKKDGPNVDIETYAFLTTTPNSLVSTIFAPEREYPPDQMRIVREGFDKEDLYAEV